MVAQNLVEKCKIKKLLSIRCAIKCSVIIMRSGETFVGMVSMKLLKFAFLMLGVCVMCSAHTSEVKKVSNATITINIYYTGKDDNARKFAEEMEQSGMVDAIREEAGNKRYEYFYPKNDEHTVLLIDAWENQEALDKHHASPMMNKITELRDKYDLCMTVERYVEDISGVPDKDKKFIKK